LENVSRLILGNDAHSQNFFGQIFGKIEQNMFTQVLFGNAKKAVKNLEKKTSLEFLNYLA